MTATQPGPLPTLTPDHGKKLQEMARASWLAPLIAILFNSFLILSGHRKFTMYIGPIFIVGGLAFGIVALFGIAKYGRRKILLPALVGIIINVSLIALAALLFVLIPKPAKLQPAIHSPNARLLRDERLRFSLDIPEGFRDFPEGKKNPSMEHLFIKGELGPGEPVMAIGIENLNGMISRRKPLRQEDAPADFKGVLSSRNWRGVPVDTIIAFPENDGMKMVAYTIQIPLKPSAIQVTVGGPLSKRKEIEQLSDKILASLEGETNW